MNQETAGMVSPMNGVRLTWGRGGIPIQLLDGAREALAALFGDCPEFEPDNPPEGRWLVALPDEAACDLAQFGVLYINVGIFTLTATAPAKKEI
ncbi:hypothetical protein AB0B89_18345 [Sphaerisporangium sp. NPDC049002]|uniref:hypothetical protein n=1 Tax=Sphaerisporangium sp. NPDC049002 TaxID=3155392 RepID=UPI0033BFCF97